MRNILTTPYRLGLAGIFFALLLYSCHKSEPMSPDVPVPPRVDRTILVYLATDNSLDSYARKNINDILKGMDEFSGRVVIYMDSRYEVPVLMTIQRHGNEWKLDTLERYGEENSASPEVLRRVAYRTRELYPASSYGLILGSHATGWLPYNVRFSAQKMKKRKAENTPLTRTFGEDVNRGDELYGYGGLALSDLADALPEGYHFILFDACLMSGIEVAYALRYKTEYILASPAEVLVDGFPYQKIMPLLWGDEPALREVCKEFWNYYENHPNGGGWCSGTIALIRTEFLDALAGQVRDKLAAKTDLNAGMTPADVWRYPLIDFNQNVFFDLGAYVRKLASENQYHQFKVWLEQAVYRLATTRFNGIPIPSDEYSGLSVYIPMSGWISANNEYYRLEWSRYVYDK